MTTSLNEITQLSRTSCRDMRGRILAAAGTPGASPRGTDRSTHTETNSIGTNGTNSFSTDTNVRDLGGTRYNGNSIFVFELADLCVAHLGHLHHTLSDQHLGELGLIDVLLVPIDGVYTIPQELMLEVIRQIGAAVIIPMHYFSSHGVERFVHLMQGRYEAVYSDTPTIVVSRLRMPYKKLVVLPNDGPSFFDDFD